MVKGATSEQWGNVKEYRVKKQPNMLDLSNYDSRAREFVARIIGVAPKKLTKEQFDEAAADIFIQNDGVDRLDQMGFTGYRFGHDAFLIGKLSDYVDAGTSPKKAGHDESAVEEGKQGFPEQQEEDFGDLE